jgi:hypothetical protein
MDVAKIRIGFEQSIGKELYTLMDGEILEEIIKKAKIEKIENEWKFILEGHSFRVTKEMMPTLHSVCLEVKAKLEFNEDIDFYINNSPELNAFSISRIENDQPHLISINSGLLERLDDDELKFIIGHEIGHLITHNADISRLISFVFPHDNKIPLIIYHKIRLWEKLSELTADRFGYMASPNLEKCVSCFFKLSSGLDTKSINFDYSAYLTENERILNYFKTEKGTNLLSHPINPMRIKAIELFSKSELYQNIINKQDKEEDKVLEEQIDTLTDILMVLSNSQIDRLRSYFIASAGIIVSGIDKQIDKEEIEKIIYELSYLSIFPPRSF